MERAGIRNFVGVHHAIASIVVLCVLIVVLLTSHIPAATGVERTPRKAYVQGLVNGQRATRDHYGLGWSDALAECAQRHAQRMADRGKAYHVFCTRDEIVGSGPRLAALFASFWRSDNHRPHILCSCGRIGVGVVRRDGLYYVVVEMN